MAYLPLMRDDSLSVLILPQRHYWIDAGCSLGRNRRGQQRGQQHNHRDQGEQQRIRRWYFYQTAAQRAIAGDTEHQADAYTADTHD